MVRFRAARSKFEVGTYYTEKWNTHPSARFRYRPQRRDWTFAVRYDLNDHLLFKIEVHPSMAPWTCFNVPEYRIPGTLKDSMTLFAAKTTFSFDRGNTRNE